MKLMGQLKSQQQTINKTLGSSVYGQKVGIGINVQAFYYNNMIRSGMPDGWRGFHGSKPPPLITARSNN